MASLPRSVAQRETGTPAMVTRESDTVQSHRKTCDWKGNRGGGPREQRASLGPDSGESQVTHAPRVYTLRPCVELGATAEAHQAGQGRAGEGRAGRPRLGLLPAPRHGGGVRTPSSSDPPPSGAPGAAPEGPLGPEAPGGGRGRPPPTQPLKGVDFPPHVLLPLGPDGGDWCLFSRGPHAGGRPLELWRVGHPQT